MKNTRKTRARGALFCLLAALALVLCACAQGQDDQLAKTARYLREENPSPGCASIGGEWVVFALARADAKTPEGYYETYLENLAAALRETDGVLSEKKYTEYSRVVLALTALGEDPSGFAGYDLLLPLADFEAVTRQGINGAVFALLALDSRGYAIPDDPDAAVQATRALYVDAILDAELPGGGWSLGGGAADVDLTAMALQALAKYRARPEVSEAVERGLALLSSLQGADGGFSSWGSESCESAAQVLVALTELGVSLDDARFVKNGSTVPDALLGFSCADGAFAHTPGGGADAMATEQACYALAALARAKDGKTTLYDLTDVIR